MFLISPQAGDSPSLYLAQCSASAEKGDQSYAQSRWQRLEQVPGSVVHEEESLHGQNRAEEQRVRNRRATERFGEMVEVRAECDPLRKKNFLVSNGMDADRRNLRQVTYGS